MFVPMVYGIPGQGHRPDDHDPDVTNKYDTILGYNEPNQKEQSDISPEDAAVHWAEVTQKYPDKVNYSVILAYSNTKRGILVASVLIKCQYDLQFITTSSV